MRVGRAFLQTLASQGIQSVASVATGILIARGLGPAGQGHYALLVAAVGLLSTLGGGGQFEGHVLGSAGRSTQGRFLLLRSMAQAALVLVVMVLVRPLWRAPLALDAGGRAEALFLTVLALEILALLFRGINLGQHQITAYNVTTLSQRILFLVFAALVAIGLGLNLTSVLVAWAGAVSANVALAAIWIWRGSEKVALSWRSLVAGWGTSLVRGLRALVTICLSLLLIRTDVYMLGPMLGVEAVGQVSVASTFTEYLWYIPSILGSVLFAAVASDRSPDTIRKLCRAVRTTVVVVGTAVAVLAILGHRIVLAMYGVAYAQAAVLVLLLLPGMFAIALHLVLDSYFAGNGFPPISYLTVAGAVIVKVAANLVLVPRAGLPGAAIATSMAYGGLLISKILAFTKETGVSPREVLVPTADDIARGVRDGGGWIRRTVGEQS